MKKIFMIIAALLITAGAMGQNNYNSLYKKYSGKKDVSSVYISPTMFKMMKSLPEIEISDDKEVRLDRIISTFDGMYIVEVDNRNLASDLSKDVNALVSSGKLELLMEAIEKDETVRIYVELKNNIVTKFVLLEQEDDSATFISIVAEMTMDDLKRLIK